jgi:hypothetical protein
MMKVLGWIAGILAAVLGALVVYQLQHIPIMEVEITKQTELIGGPYYQTASPKQPIMTGLVNSDRIKFELIRIKNPSGDKLFGCAPYISVVALPGSAFGGGSGQGQPADIEPGGMREWHGLDAALDVRGIGNRVLVGASCYYYDVLHIKRRKNFTEEGLFYFPNFKTVIKDAEFEIRDKELADKITQQINEAEKANGRDRVRLLQDTLKTLESAKGDEPDIQVSNLVKDIKVLIMRAEVEPNISNNN